MVRHMDRQTNTMVKQMDRQTNSLVRQTDLCGFMVKADSVYSTPFPRHSDVSSVQSSPSLSCSPTVGIMFKMGATLLLWWFDVTATKTVPETELLIQCLMMLN